MFGVRTVATLQADANWHGESGRALLNPLVEDWNGGFGVRLLHVLEQARAAERPCGRDRKAPRAGRILRLRNRHIPAWQFCRTDSQLNLLRALLPLLRIGLSDRDDLNGTAAREKPELRSPLPLKRHEARFGAGASEAVKAEKASSEAG